MVICQENFQPRVLPIMIFIFEKWFNRNLFCVLSFYRSVSFLLSVFFIVLEAFQKLQAKTHPLKFVTT